MGAMADTDAKNVLISDTVFTEYKGAFTEQYVLQQLLASNINNIYYYSSDTSRMEMDFIIQQKGALVPIEVKGGTSIKATSLHNYLKQHQDIPAVRFNAPLSQTGKYNQHAPIRCVSQFGINMPVQNERIVTG